MYILVLRLIWGVILCMWICRNGPQWYRFLIFSFVWDFEALLCCICQKWLNKHDVYCGKKTSQLANIMWGREGGWDFKKGSTWKALSPKRKLLFDKALSKINSIAKFLHIALMVDNTVYTTKNSSKKYIMPITIITARPGGELVTSVVYL